MKRRPIDEQLLDALANGELEEFERAIAAGGNVNLRVEDDMPLIHVASLRSEPAFVRALVAGGADVDARDDKGRTALFFSVLLGSQDQQGDLVKALVKGGADVNRRACGRSPLELAAQHENTEIVRLLLRHGAVPSGRWHERIERLTRNDRRER